MLVPHQTPKLHGCLSTEGICIFNNCSIIKVVPHWSLSVYFIQYFLSKLLEQRNFYFIYLYIYSRHSLYISTKQSYSETGVLGVLNVPNVVHMHNSATFWPPYYVFIENYIIHNYIFKLGILFLEYKCSK